MEASDPLVSIHISLLPQNRLLQFILIFIPWWNQKWVYILALVSLYIIYNLDLNPIGFFITTSNTIPATIKITYLLKYLLCGNSRLSLMKPTKSKLQRHHTMMRLSFVVWCWYPRIPHSCNYFYEIMYSYAQLTSFEESHLRHTCKFFCRRVSLRQCWIWPSECCSRKPP